MNDTTFARRRPRDFDGSSSAEAAVFAATEKLLAQTSLQDLTVAQVIAEAGVSRANFYHYFANKFDVLIALLRRLLDESYSEAGPWTGTPGRARAQRMGSSLDNTLRMWQDHGPMIGAVIEHMHSRPTVGAAWQQVFDRFVASVAEQIEFERSQGRAPDGPDARTLAAMLVGAAERTFYVAFRGLDPRLGGITEVAGPVSAVTETAIYARVTDAPPPELASEVARLSAPQVDGTTARGLLDALRALLDEHPLADVSVGMVLERAKVSRASFYFYFRNIEDAFTVLFQEAAVQIVDGMAALTEIGPADGARMRELVARWLDGPDSAVIRNAVHTWPRLTGLRAAYLDAMNAMETRLEAALEVQRARGVVPAETPAPEYAAVLLWTIDRTVAGWYAGEAWLDDRDTVSDAVARLLTAALFGQISHS